MSRHFLFLIVFAGAFLLPALFVYAQQPEEPDPELTIHVVQRGENLFRIALSYGLTTDELAIANGITNADSIQVGQRLIIPVNGLPIAEEIPSPREHIVQFGETLLTIAIAYGMTPEELASLNNITDTNSLFVGQVLMIEEPGGSITPDIVMPQAPVTAPENNTENAFDTPQASTQSIGTVTHVVQSGETLFRIATQYDKTVDELQTANNITDPTVIYAGQELIIPNVEFPQPVVELPSGITMLEVVPTFFTEGRTGRVRVETAEAATVSGTFLDCPLTVISNDTATTHFILIGVPIYTEANIYPLTLNVIPNTSGLPIDLSTNIQVFAGNYGFQRITLPEDRMNLLSPGVEENELNIIQTVISPFNPEKYFDGPMSLPAAAPMNGIFGPQRSYNGGPFDRYHNGSDFAGAPGSPILAAASGTVVMADTLNIRGISVIIDHGWGVYTNYSHMTERLVQIGDFVTTGQTIGTVGNTGRATGAHLHWELWVNGVAVDPMQWVSQSFP